MSPCKRRDRHKLQYIQPGVGARIGHDDPPLEGVYPLHIACQVPRRIIAIGDRFLFVPQRERAKEYLTIVALRPNPACRTL